MPNYSWAQALLILRQYLPDGVIKKRVEHNGRYYFMVFRPDLEEEVDYDPFYYVDSMTGEFSDYSIVDDFDHEEVMKKFVGFDLDS